MLKSPLIIIAAGALLIGSAGAALSHTAILGSGARVATVAADECGAQGEQQGDNDDPACAADQPGETTDTPEPGDTTDANDQGDMQHGAAGATGATGASGQQSGQVEDQQGQHGFDGEQEGDNSD
ncbi:MAG: hypothetical protein M3Z65_01635 [Chloroflexota bacterium]|nr:hypothetical protein [Chloroflexota bacterium]